jgi:CHAT domain-containing protein
MRKNVLGENHPLYSDTQNDLALLYMQNGQFSKAEPLFLSSSAIMLKNIASNFPILSDKEKANYLDYNKSFIECNNSYVYLNRHPSPAILENNYNLELNFKSYSLADTRNMLALVRNSKDSLLRKTFEEWNNLKTFLAKQYSLPAKERDINLKNREAEAENLEKELNRRSAAFSNKQRSLNITFKDVREHLENNEAAIEFVRFRLYNRMQTDSFLYAAYLLRKEDVSPLFIYLCEENQLKKIFDSAGVTATRMVKSLYRGPGTTIKEEKLSTRLYQLIWKPLEPFLDGIGKIAYSPAGSLYGIAFHAMTTDTNHILMDKYQLRQYTSTRQVALRELNTDEEKAGSIVLFGNPLFSMDSLQLVKKRIHKENNVSTSFTAARGGGLGIWSSLPGTAEEIKAIKDLFDQNRIESASFTGEEASEENLKSLEASSPKILHIATHGFFLPQPEKMMIGAGNVYSLSNDPLLRSGLVLSGGNYVWSGRTPVAGIEDGIATAYEISQLNLGNTELVVLSACETALGDIKGTEGVFGLQRGFKMAGVKKMIVSLWQVPDKETAELMTGFYSNWLGGKTISNSFYEAQSVLRKKYPAYYWAAFVLVE